MKALIILVIGLIIGSCTKAKEETNIEEEQFLHSIEVSSVIEVQEALSKIKEGQTLVLLPGEYKHLKLVVRASGTSKNPIYIKSKKPGEAIITGNCKVELRGEYITLDGFLFKNGMRNSSEWRSHGPGLIAIYGSHNRVTECVVDGFNDVTNSYITTSLTPEGKAPQYCRIDHCSFMNKTTNDQVMNLNNTAKKSITGPAGIPMYHRVDHCYFYNPVKKSGNAGGGVRIGYWRKDYGRCRVDSNMFVRQNSEPEIITSKSMENIYYQNTFIDCDGTMNFRHGDKQVLLQNFFISNDTKHDAGGAFIWGSGHMIAGNYFSLRRTMASRGHAALYLNSGAKEKEHALAYNITIANNFFANNNGYAVDLQGLKDRRIPWCKEKGYTYEDPHSITFNGNIFYQESYSYDFFSTDQPAYDFGVFEKNYIYGSPLGINKKISEVLSKEDFKSKDSDGVYPLPSCCKPAEVTYRNIEGIDLDISQIASEGVKGKPLVKNDVGASWYKIYE
ncbi:hypothetical protein K5X82_10655 [Halosquirtibacter xylanolyticus]|uniref:chondroitinase-B domain-containing protein n=1 Tax=Halosquirtibacter xylanolyticus TaxID=3374599 RepID=UPI003749EB64|nr:hypothetical protein K5X82_10655 [Prolixibacteraceae bacterium]